MSDQDKINQLEAQNRALVEAIEYSLWEALTYYEKTEVVLDALSNSPDVSLYRKEQEVISEAEEVSQYINCFHRNTVEREAMDDLVKAIANLQQARKEK